MPHGQSVKETDNLDLVLYQTYFALSAFKPKPANFSIYQRWLFLVQSSVCFLQNKQLFV